jgi:HK97 family phage major capsid protein
MSEINDLQNITHQYRKSLEAFEERTNKQARMIDLAGNGEERQTIARMDADLSAIEQRMQDMAALKAAAEHRAAALEAKLAEPTYRAKPTDAKIVDRSSEEYAARWLKAVATGDAGEMRALSLGSGGAGIPTDMERRIVDRMFQANVMRQICPVSTIDSKRTIPVQNALPTTALVAEAGTITPADPTFSTAISVVPYKLVTAVTMSQEFIEDAIGNGGIGSGLQYVADKCGLSIALKQEEFYTVGTGSTQPQGICDTSGGVTQGVDLGDAITTLDLGRGHRRGARGAGRVPQLAAVPLALSDTALKVIRKLKDTAGYYVYSPAASINATNVVGLPGTIYGVPYSVGQYVPTRTARATEVRHRRRLQLLRDLRPHRHHLDGGSVLGGGDAPVDALRVHPHGQPHHAARGVRGDLHLPDLFLPSAWRGKPRRAVYGDPHRHHQGRAANRLQRRRRGAR